MAAGTMTPEQIAAMKQIGTAAANGMSMDEIMAQATKIGLKAGMTAADMASAVADVGKAMANASGGLPAGMGAAMIDGAMAGGAGKPPMAGMTPKIDFDICWDWITDKTDAKVIKKFREAAMDVARLAMQLAQYEWDSKADREAFDELNKENVEKARQQKL